MRHCSPFVVSFALLAGCATTTPPAQRQSMETEVAKAQLAFGQLRDRLLARLQQALAQGDTAAAVAVCSGEAPKFAAEISQASHFAVGRTSARLRNPKNAPPTWALPLVENRGHLRAETVSLETVDLGDRVGVLAPIALAAPCLGCHGPKASLDPSVAATLGAIYPDDAATGFAVGDLRGWFWAEVPRR